MSKESNASADVGATSRSPVVAGTVAGGLAIMLVAVNLRPIFSSLSAVLPEVMGDTGLGYFGAGVLTTLPIIFLGVFALVAPYLSRRFGARNTIFFMLLLLSLGTAVRGIHSLPLIFFGQGLAGACIAIGNVLLPGFVKQEFPSKAGLLTGLYTASLCAGASLGAGLTVPIEQTLDGSWSSALSIWAVLPLVVAMAWIPRIGKAAQKTAAKRVAIVGLWKDLLAWQITLFMGLQSSIAYICFGWLAPILRGRSLDASTAGYMVSAMIVAQMVASLLVPPIAVRRPNQQLINVLLASCAVVGMLGLLFAPLNTILIWVILSGFSQGGLIAIALTIIVLRSPSAEATPYLSGMAQSVGYVLAAIGPLLVGAIYKVTGSFDWIAVPVVLFGVAMMVVGYGSGRARHVKCVVKTASHDIVRP